MSVDKQFIVERQGKAFVLYAGILDLATKSGLTSLMTRIVQLPSPENGNTAVVEATAVLESEGITRTFTEIGDASPANVAPAMKSAIIRMAATRAKARAMRDAVNVGVTAFEELGSASVGNDEEQVPPPKRRKPLKDPLLTRKVAALKSWKENYTEEALTRLLGHEMDAPYVAPDGTKVSAFNATFKNLTQSELEKVEGFIVGKVELPPQEVTA